MRSRSACGLKSTIGFGPKSNLSASRTAPAASPVAGLMIRSVPEAVRP
jgi:hypothetical protein